MSQAAEEDTTGNTESLSPGLSSYLGLLQEVGDLKRIRAAGIEGSVASDLFRRSWGALSGGAGLRETALSTTASALCAARLGAVDESILAVGGLSPGEVREVMLAGFDGVSSPLPSPLRESLRDEAGVRRADRGTGAFADVPGFVGALARQPRAGATRPGGPRLILEPPESHAEHCATVAVYGVTLSGAFGADAAPVFLAGLCHHLHNSGLPDSGFTGEQLLGDHLEQVAGKFRESALEELPEKLRDESRAAMLLTGHADSPEARAFHAADVLDRVLQMRHYERQAGFTLDQALGEMDLIHPGPLKEFQYSVLSGASIL